MLDCKLDADGGIWVTSCGGGKIFGTPWLRPRLLFPKFFMFFFSDRPMNDLTKFEVRSFTRSWDNRGTPKILSAPEYAHAPFLRTKFLWVFIWIGPINVLTKFEVCSCTHCRDNRGYPKNLDSPYIRPRSIFSKIFNGLLFGMAI